MRKEHAIFYFLLGTIPASSPVAAEDNLTPLLKAQTVMISVSRERVGSGEGSGIILCQDESQAYILTARHVIFGKSEGNIREAEPSEINRIEISFLGNLVLPVIEKKDEKVITKQWAGKKKDLVLLTMPMTQTLPAVAVGTASAGAQPETEAGARRPTVFTVGYEQREKASPAPWTFLEGKLIPADREYLYHDAAVTSGFSGGPLFDESGALIGVNVEIVTGLEIGAEPGAKYGRALPIGPVIETVNKWLPGDCLRNVAPVQEVAYETYRRAMRAVSIKDWKGAERLMGQALQYLPQEGGNVHLQGMRYTTYLPRYHLGLALYKQNRCGEALREWGRSETQQAIQEDRRYRKLGKFKQRCIANMRQEIQKAAAAPTEVK